MEQIQMTLPPVNLDGTGLHVGIIVARYNWEITGHMLSLAHEELLLLGVESHRIQIYSVPGAYELPLLAQALLKKEHFDVLLCLGCVMKGATRHDVIIGDAAGQGLQRVALDTGIPLIFGVICAENQQQAEERIQRGQECARTAIEMALLLQNR
ncbi:6,7-dimethyl-8-ribityllumazine synthase [Tengunoibacter tsumagoiensis]|uniref:6,7-dimethyl-8-ribityllumazine synthase n=1 Tax=Tengunoibacter tsumagoiensis TaxID=2014871 RepID=A0A402A1D8_9CHLR|nr:6,7-dimethyl-8-ribityllumazine synthase [Tengunoibacter tsumagoiensis]GCE12872.1 6,7-dimethyl-8-ribityllumazine synthase [Tengunoibacter tsumagoiensis]